MQPGITSSASLIYARRGEASTVGGRVPRQNIGWRRFAVAACLVLALILGEGLARADWDCGGTLSPGTSVLDAYTSEASVVPGGTVHFHVSTRPREPYRILIYRLGWWRGSAPARLACAPSCRGVKQGAA